MSNYEDSKNLKHDRIVWPMLGVWCVLVAHVAADAETFSADMVAYDYRSLLWAAAVALLGGVFRTIISLATDARPVVSLLRESWREAITSILAGGGAYVAIEALRSLNVGITGELRFAMILSAGVWRMSFFTWANNSLREVADAWKERFKPRPPGSGAE